MFLIRRLRYAFAGHLMRAVTSIVSIIAILVVIFVMLSGWVDQRSVFETVTNFTLKSSKNIADDIENGNTPFEVNDRGIYLKKGQDVEPNEENADEESLKEKENSEEEEKNPEEKDGSEEKKNNPEEK